MPAFSFASALASIKERGASAWRPAAFHILISAVVASAVAAVFFVIWFPAPLHELMGGFDLFFLILGVDVACGPLLTLILFNPAKPRAELRRDLALVALIQLLALGYGMHALSYARPLALVHEVDRFRLLSFADFDEADASKAPEWAQPWGFSPLRTVGIRSAATSDEKWFSINAALQGVEPSQRPSWWQDYALSVPQVLQRARPLAELRSKHLRQSALLDAAAAHAMTDVQIGETTNPAALRWLPVVSRRTNDWVVLLDPMTGRTRGYVHLDGF